jgi:hypothetical protein
VPSRSTGMRIQGVNNMSNTYFSVPPTVQYCPRCADAFGTINGAGKRCRCSNSEGIEPFHGDFYDGFEICYYCQAELIHSRSRWSTFYCEYCRPVVRAINEVVDRWQLVSLPIGRHSLMHTSWRYARPFTATGIVAKWSKSRLRSGWKSYSGQSDPAPWAEFGQFQREVREGEYPEAIQKVVALVQNTEPDHLLSQLRAANARIAKRRRA